MAKHSGARHVRVLVGRQKGAVVLSVEDDGKGFDVATMLGAKERGIGLLSMQERASLLDGRLRIESESGRGTRVEVEILRAALGELR